MYMMADNLDMVIVSAVPKRPRLRPVWKSSGAATIRSKRWELMGWEEGSTKALANAGSQAAALPVVLRRWLEDFRFSNSRRAEGSYFTRKKAMPRTT